MLGADGNENAESQTDLYADKPFGDRKADAHRSSALGHAPSGIAAVALMNRQS